MINLFRANNDKIALVSLHFRFADCSCPVLTFVVLSLYAVVAFAVVLFAFVNDKL